jgi:excinuclease ABC subunit A
VIEHNMDVIKVADHIIDIGPEGGFGGGKVLFEGTPEQMLKVKESFTAQFLKQELM